MLALEVLLFLGQKLVDLCELQNDGRQSPYQLCYWELNLAYRLERGVPKSERCL